eukprot:3808170-Alexandrium_andersonii.AAC.1
MQGPPTLAQARMRLRTVAKWGKPDSCVYDSPMFGTLVNQGGNAAKKMHLAAARILEQVSRRLPSSFTDRQLFVGWGMFIHPE